MKLKRNKRLEKLGDEVSKHSPLIVRIPNCPGVTPDKNNFQFLLDLLAKHGGTIISSNDLHPDLIKQAEASHRMYVDENNLGYVWEPPIAGRFPTTDEEVEMFEWCYPLDVEMPEGYSEKILDKIITGLHDKSITKHTAPQPNLEEVEKLVQIAADKYALDAIVRRRKAANSYDMVSIQSTALTRDEYAASLRTRIGYTLDANGKAVAIRKGGEDG